MLSASTLIQTLALEPHPLEGGYFKRTYTSGRSIGTAGSTRCLASAIYYCLTEDSPVGYLHRNASDIVHCFHAGAPLSYFLISPEGEFHQAILGNQLDAGQTPQLMVPANWWKASQLPVHNGDWEYGLISEVVVPGFDYADNQVAKADHLAQWAPRVQKVILTHGLLAPGLS